MCTSPYCTEKQKETYHKPLPTSVPSSGEPLNRPPRPSVIDKLITSYKKHKTEVKAHLLLLNITIALYCLVCAVDDLDKKIAVTFSPFVHYVGFTIWTLIFTAILLIASLINDSEGR